MPWFIQYYLVVVVGPHPNNVSPSDIVFCRFRLYRIIDVGISILRVDLWLGDLVVVVLGVFPGMTTYQEQYQFADAAIPHSATGMGRALCLSNQYSNEVSHFFSGSGANATCQKGTLLTRNLARLTLVMHVYCTCLQSILAPWLDAEVFVKVVFVILYFLIPLHEH